MVAVARRRGDHAQPRQEPRRPRHDRPLAGWKPRRGILQPTPIRDRLCLLLLDGRRLRDVSRPAEHRVRTADRCTRHVASVSRVQTGGPQWPGCVRRLIRHLRCRPRRRGVVVVHDRMARVRHGEPLCDRAGPLNGVVDRPRVAARPRHRGRRCAARSVRSGAGGVRLLHGALRARLRGVSRARSGWSVTSCGIGTSVRSSRTQRSHRTRSSGPSR
jgi:hypothetical protein